MSSTAHKYVENRNAYDSPIEMADAAISSYVPDIDLIEQVLAAA